MGILDNINFLTPPSPETSTDFRLLDTTCDHLIRNENSTDFNIDDLLDPANYSVPYVMYNNFSYGGQINPDATTIIKTKYPYVNTGSLTVSQVIDSTTSTPVEETFIVSELVGDIYPMAFPPKTNSVSAKQKIYVNDNDFRLVPFTSYVLSQLFGRIQFTNVDDAGTEVIFTYLADKKRIYPVDLSTNLANYEVLGEDQNGRAIIKIYGRALVSTKSKIVLRYGTDQRSCTKCAGAGILNDIFFDYNGKIQEVYDFSKMIQDFFKRLLTIKGSSPFDPNEGTSVTAYVGMAKTDGFVLSDLIKSDIVNLIYTIRDKQNLQGNLQGISLAEQIAQVNDISVRISSPTDMEVIVEVVSKSGLIQQITAKVET